MLVKILVPCVTMLALLYLICFFTFINFAQSKIATVRHVRVVAGRDNLQCRSIDFGIVFERDERDGGNGEGEDDNARQTEPYAFWCTANVESGWESVSVNLPVTKKLCMICYKDELSI